LFCPQIDPKLHVPPLHWMWQSSPRQFTVHVDPASHVALHPPPVHCTVQFAPAAHVVLHLPDVHCSEHVLFASHVVGQPLAAVNGHSRLQFPSAGQLQFTPSQRPAPPEDPGVGGGVVPPSGVPLPTVQS